MKKYNVFYDLRNGKPCFLIVNADNEEQATLFANAAVVENGDYKKINKRGVSVTLA